MISRRLLVTFVSASILLAGACAKDERASTADVIKQVVTAARPKLRVQVLIRASADEPTAADQQLLRSLEDAIERKNVGRIVSSGVQSGDLFITIEVDNTVDATTTLRSILTTAGVRDRSSLKVTQPD